ncbi:MAG: lysoplasmalogenase [Pseudomonadota bacterium]
MIEPQTRLQLLASLSMGFCLCSVGASLSEAAVLAGLAKSLASISFILCALTANALATVYGRVIFAGLVFSALGDALLIGSSPLWFLAGLSSFLLAHIWYSAAFWRRGVKRSGLLLSAVPIASFGALVVIRLWPELEAGMRAPVIAYVVAICMMVALAIGSHLWTRNHWLWTGAVAFMISDLAVAADRFIVSEPLNFIWGLPLYYGAQLLLIGSIVKDSSTTSSNFAHTLK